MLLHLTYQLEQVMGTPLFADVVLPEHGVEDILEARMLSQQIPNAGSYRVQTQVNPGLEIEQNGFTPQLLEQDFFVDLYEGRQ